MIQRNKNPQDRCALRRFSDATAVTPELINWLGIVLVLGNKLPGACDETQRCSPWCGVGKHDSHANPAEFFHTRILKRALARQTLHFRALGRGFSVNVDRKTRRQHHQCAYSAGAGDRRKRLSPRQTKTKPCFKITMGGKAESGVADLTRTTHTSTRHPLEDK